MFWIPELVRKDLEPHFLKVQNLQTFWEFLESDLGSYVFYKDSVINPKNVTEVDRSMINKFDGEPGISDEKCQEQCVKSETSYCDCHNPTFSSNSKGRFF